MENFEFKLLLLLLLLLFGLFSSVPGVLMISDNDGKGGIPGSIGIVVVVEPAFRLSGGSFGNCGKFG